MSDVALKYQYQQLEISLSNDLLLDNGLETAIILSLFTDTRVNEYPNDADKQGWWGDLFTDQLNDQIGSKLWLLQREKRTNETLNKAEDYALDALKWIIDDGVADFIEVRTEYQKDLIVLNISIHQPSKTKQFRYALNWQNQMEKL